MATLYPSQELTMNWSAAEWSEADNNAKNHAAPVDGDAVVFTANSSAAITLDADQIDIELASFDMTGYAGTFAMGEDDLDVDGPVTLDGTITASTGGRIYCDTHFIKTAGMTALPSVLYIVLDGTGNVTCNSVTGGFLAVNTAATHTLADDGYFSGYWQNAGTLVGTGYTLYVNGAVYRSGGTVTNVTVEQTGTSNLGPFGVSPLLEYRADASAVITLIGDVQANKVTLAAGSSVSGDFAFYIYLPTASNFLDMAGTVGNTFDVQIYGSYLP